MKEDEKLLSRFDWEMECYSPFEIRSKDGCSFATGEAAQIILGICREEAVEKDEEIKEIDEAVRYMRTNINFHLQPEWIHKARIIIQAYFDKLEDD